MIVVIDNFFSKNEHAEIVNQYESGMFSNRDEYFDRNHHKFVEEIIASSRRYIDYDVHIGYEMHFNNGILIPHRDKDNGTFWQTEHQVFPLVGLVYYIKAPSFGGELVFPEDGASVSPKDRRLIIFERHMLHYVNEYEGERISLGINPWDYIPTEYRR